MTDTLPTDLPVALKRVLIKAVALLALVTALAGALAVEGPGLAIEGWLLLPPLLLCSAFSLVALNLYRKTKKHEAVSTHSAKAIVILNLILLSIPAIGLAISLVLAAIGALMVGNPLGALTTVILAIAVPVLFFVSHFQLLRLIKEINL